MLKDKMKRWGKRALILALVLGGIVGTRAYYRDVAGGVEKQHELELAKKVGVITAVEKATKKLKKELDVFLKSNSRMRAEVDRIKAIAPTVEVRELVRWKTRTVEVPFDRLVRVPVHTVCPGLDPTLELPPVKLYAMGEEVRLRSEAGNYFVVGTVSLWRLWDNSPAELLFTEPWEVDATDVIIVRDEVQAYRKLGYWGGILRRDEDEFAYDQGEGFQRVVDKYAGVGGVSWRWGRVEAMVGLTTDPGVMVLGSWHKRK